MHVKQFRFLISGTRVASGNQQYHVAQQYYLRYYSRGVACVQCSLSVHQHCYDWCKRRSNDDTAESLVRLATLLASSTAADIFRGSCPLVNSIQHYLFRADAHRTEREEKERSIYSLADPEGHKRNNRRDWGRLVPQILGWGPTMYWSSATSWP